MLHCDTLLVRGDWNHNTYYRRALLRRLPARFGRALDVGCGDGRFARELASRADEVAAIDVDPRELESARAAAAGVPGIRWLCADLMTYEADSQFDVVTALAVIHHLSFDEALTTMSRLLAPGGRLLVLGLWPPTAAATDVAVSAVATVTNAALQVARGRTTMTSPSREPETPLHEVRRRTTAALPRATVSRCLLWRYILDWTKPTMTPCR